MGRHAYKIRKTVNNPSEIDREDFFMKKFGVAKDAFVFLLALVCAASLYLVWRLPAFETGDGYTFYYGTSSSAAMKTVSYAAVVPQGVRGESTVYPKRCAKEIVKRYRAEVLFTEEVCGTVNYYCYSPCLPYGVELCGKTVNLHVAENAEQTAVGSPVIFGGF